MGWLQLFLPRHFDLGERKKPLIIIRSQRSPKPLRPADLVNVVKLDAVGDTLAPVAASLAVTHIARRLAEPEVPRKMSTATSIPIACYIY